MYDQLDTMQAAVDSTESIPRFGYTASALLTNDGIEGHNEYSDNNSNNIPLADGTQLSLQEIEKGFRDNISTLSRAFLTHFFGRSSYNINRMRTLLSSVLGTCKADYAHNFRAWDSTATYMENDVCFLVAYGIRYCFKSLIDDNTDPIEAHADGTLEYDEGSWVLLTEQRDVRHPVGKPFIWFGGTLPDNYICFSDGSQKYWADYPELNNPEFRALLTRFTRYGARANDETFNVPNINELYPMSTDLPEEVSTIAAKIPPHGHLLQSGIVQTNSTTSTNHTHPTYSTNNSGGHRHYLGDYQSSQHSVAADGAWHEDSKFYGDFVYEGIGSHDNEYHDYRITLYPSIGEASGNAILAGKPNYWAPHYIPSVTAKTLPHTHSGAVTPSGAGDFGEASGKYRPGTVKTILAVRAS